MKLFNLFASKTQHSCQSDDILIISSAAKGTIIPMEDIPDAVFNCGIMGPCVGIDPADEVVVSPLSGTVTCLPDTLHAVGIMGDNGIEVLIHIGIDTIGMNGNGFNSHVIEGEHVTPGQKLISFDKAKIRSFGYSAVIVQIILNGDDFGKISLLAEGMVDSGEPLFSVNRNN